MSFAGVELPIWQFCVHSAVKLYFFKQSVIVGRVLRLRWNTQWQQNANFNSLWLRESLEKGVLFGTPSLTDCLTGLTGSSTRAFDSSMADCQALN